MLHQPIDISALPPDLLLNDREVAVVLRTTPGGVRNWRYHGRGPRVVRLGASVRYRVRDVLAFLDACTVDPATTPND